MVEEQLKSGDLVRRDNNDIWRVISIPEVYDPFKDRARCVCARAPLGWLRPDGSRSKPWAKVGDEDTFTIADLELLPSDALSAMEPADYANPDKPVRFAGASPAILDLKDFSIGSGEAEDAECRRIEIEQNRGPTIEFTGRLLCTCKAEDAEPGSPAEMTIYQTAGGTLIAVSTDQMDEYDRPGNVRALVIEIGDEPQAAHFAVLDHFDWNQSAQAMITQELGWSLRLKVE